MHRPPLPLLLGGLVIATAAAAGPAVTDATTPAAGAPAATQAKPVTFASLNIKYSVRRADARRDFERVARTSGADAIGLQEFDGRDRARFLAGRPAWRFYRPSRGQARTNAVAWHASTFTVEARRAQRLSDVGYDRPGGTRIYSWATKVRLRHRATGRSVHLISTHLPSGVQGGDGPRPGAEARVREMQAALDGLRRMVQGVPAEAAVVVTGDFNWDSRADGWPGSPENRLRPLLRSVYEATGDGPGTHAGGRGIDYVFLRPAPHHRFGRKGVVGGLHSDHSAVWARTRLRPAPAAG